MNNSFTFTVTLILLISGLNLSGHALSPKKGIPSVDLFSKEQGTVIVDQMIIREYQNKTPIHQIQAKHVLFSENNRQLQIQNVKIRIRDKNGKDSVIESDKSSYNISTKIFKLQDNIQYLSGNGGKLSCNSLQWDMENDRIFVPGKFTLVKDNAILRATNLITNRNLDIGEMHNIEAINR